MQRNPDLGRSTNLISIRGGRLCPPNYYPPNPPEFSDLLLTLHIQLTRNNRGREWVATVAMSCHQVKIGGKYDLIQLYRQSYIKMMWYPWEIVRNDFLLQIKENEENDVKRLQDSDFFGLVLFLSTGDQNWLTAQNIDVENWWPLMITFKSIVGIINLIQFNLILILFSLTQVKINSCNLSRCQVTLYQPTEMYREWSSFGIWCSAPN